MIKIGMIIGGRYELLEKIGIGGTSEVYKVKDFKLNRFGAAKILKQEFSINGDFISKFRMEAQMAAGIMHPNIIDVYDAGEEDGIFYIVMGSVYYISPEQASGGCSDEQSNIYSPGITIFEMLTGRVPFSGEATVEIAID